MKNIFHLFVLINLTVNLYCVGVVNKGYYLVYISSFSSSELEKIKAECNKVSCIAYGQSGQPSALMSVNKTDKTGKEIIIECDKSVEKIRIFSDGMKAGKIEYKGQFVFDGLNLMHKDRTAVDIWESKYNLNISTMK